MATNKKIYTLIICYDDDNDKIEWLEETLDREYKLPDNIYETKDLEELEQYLKKLPKLTIVGEA